MLADLEEAAALRPPLLWSAVRKRLVGEYNLVLENLRAVRALAGARRAWTRLRRIGDSEHG